jgi:hypothetical protein
MRPYHRVTCVLAISTVGCGSVVVLESDESGAGGSDATEPPCADSFDPEPCDCPPEPPEELTACDLNGVDCIYEVEAACGEARLHASCDIMFKHWNVGEPDCE